MRRERGSLKEGPFFCFSATFFGSARDLAIPISVRPRPFLTAKYHSLFRFILSSRNPLVALRSFVVMGEWA